jgi:hypothetical protein
MARYLEVAAKASEVVDGIMDRIKDHPNRDEIASQLVYLYNLGIRTSPRPCQSTVRLNAVVRAAKNQPLKVRFVEKTAKGFKGEYTYKAINISSTRQPDLPTLSDDTADLESV